MTPEISKLRSDILSLAGSGNWPSVAGKFGLSTMNSIFEVFGGAKKFGPLSLKTL
jgi:hypothetical protein